MKRRSLFASLLLLIATYVAVLTRAGNWREVGLLSEASSLESWKISFLNNTKKDVLTSSTAALAEPKKAEIPQKPLSRKGLINDQTLFWDKTVSRHWLLGGPESNHTPPYMVLLTNYGFNHPNQTWAKTLYRGVRTRELLEGVINHPYFNPDGFEDLAAGRADTTMKYYIFLDREACIEKNYPHYGTSRMKNGDKKRHYGKEFQVGHLLSAVADVLESRWFQDAKRARLVVFQCDQTPRLILTRRSYSKESAVGRRMTLATLTAITRLVQPQDVGLLPPTVQRYTLTADDQRQIATCNESSRPLTFFFRGNYRTDPIRAEMGQLHNGKDVLVEDVRGTAFYAWMKDNSTTPEQAFLKLGKLSKFGGAPRGDRHFSYRFSELLSMGTIPVVYSDDWFWPFGPELFSWEDISVRVPVTRIGNTTQILNNISDEQRCKMRQRLAELYNEYMANDNLVIKGILETLERRFPR